MEKKFVLHMNGGNGAVSYAKNSGLQKFVILKTWPILDVTLKDMFTNDVFSKALKIVDLGCASGPNTSLVISHIMDTIETLRKHDESFTEYEVYLNDLPDNDFNNLFKILPDFHHGRKNCFVFGLPGSFHERLLPSNSLHFAYSCFSLHWLSQIPKEIKKNNKVNICIARTSPAEVFEAYAQQFRQDFWRFLRCRGEEIMSGGHMVLAFLGRRVEDQCFEDLCVEFKLLAETLADMVTEGLLNKDDLHSFNVPLYTPCRQEVEAIVGQEGSFNVNRMEVINIPFDANAYKQDGQVFDKYRSGKLVVDCVRAFMEPMLVYHFNNAIEINDVFDRYTQKMVEHFSLERPSHITLVMSFNRK